MRSATIALLVLAGLSIASSEAWAQRNFSRRQQAAMQVYITQLQNQQRMQQQAQLQRISQQFDIQQRAILQERQRSNQLIDALEDLGNPDNQGVSSRRAAVFGNPHFNSAYYFRYTPYFDYRFVVNRNRINTNLGAPTIP